MVKVRPFVKCFPLFLSHYSTYLYSQILNQRTLHVNYRVYLYSESDILQRLFPSVFLFGSKDFKSGHLKTMTDTVCLQGASMTVFLEEMSLKSS